jgi:glycine/D-amino acid oxidase-like deaminating enzyme/nitrite reductase/ring-hydroxylating ferredoxin subunit
MELQGEAMPYWVASTQLAEYPALNESISVDAAVIGGGMVGITTAYMLKEAGLRVAVLDFKRILKGVTGHTTAKITSLHGLIYEYLLGQFGPEQARQYADSNQAAIEKIASLVETLGIDCDFVRETAVTYAETESTRRKIEREVDAAQRLGLPARFLETLPLPYPTKGAIALDNQARFHPRRYLKALAEKIPGDGSHIFENTRAVDIEKGNPCKVITSGGLTIRAPYVVVATHFPFYDKPGLYFARMFPIQSYAIGMRIAQEFPGGMYITAEENGRSLRVQPTERGPMIILGGENHKVGHDPDTIRRYRALEMFAKQMYTVESIDYRWSTQDCVTIDYVPYIGQLSINHERIYVATGFAEWGMTKATLSAMILSDMIQGKQNSWADVYNPSRFKAFTSAKEFFTANLDVARYFIGDRLGHGTKGNPADLGDEEGMMMEVDGTRVAAYRDKAGVIYQRDPHCTHMGCLLHWNTADQTWDCPCHGSRFKSSGTLLQGPAVEDMKAPRPKS